MQIIYLDTETTGLRPEHCLIEIAMHTEIDGILRSWSSKIRTRELLVDPEALAYNKIDLREMINWPYDGEVLGDFYEKMHEWGCVEEGEIVKDLVACGFNVKFDVTHVNKFVGQFFSHRVLDLTSVALFHGLPAKSNQLIERYGDPSIEAHSAYNDALNAYYVHKAMLRELKDA